MQELIVELAEMTQVLIKKKHLPQSGINLINDATNIMLKNVVFVNENLKTDCQDIRKRFNDLKI